MQIIHTKYIHRSLQVVLIVDIDHLPQQPLVDPLEVDLIEGRDCLDDTFDQFLLALVQLTGDLPL